MKPWGACRTTGIASAAGALLLVGTLVWLLNKPAIADCITDAPADAEAHEIRAAKIVVQPWLGPHHVYGVFVLPNRYRHEEKYAVTMTIRGFDHHFAVAEKPDKRHVDHVFAPPGHYVLRGYVPTRLALWFLATGLFNDLRDSCNWTLMFIERSSIEPPKPLSREWTENDSVHENLG